MTIPITTNLSQSKRLKELGALQYTHFGWFGRSGSKITSGKRKGEFIADLLLMSHEEYRITKSSDYFVEWELVYAAPTLSDLIDWLGEEFWQLEDTGAGWLAKANTFNELIIPAKGATPIDALVALYEAMKSPFNQVTK